MYIKNILSWFPSYMSGPPLRRYFKLLLAIFLYPLTFLLGTPYYGYLF